MNTNAIIFLLGFVVPLCLFVFMYYYRNFNYVVSIVVVFIATFSISFIPTYLNESRNASLNSEFYKTHGKNESYELSQEISVHINHSAYSTETNIYKITESSLSFSAFISIFCYLIIGITTLVKRLIRR